MRRPLIALLTLLVGIGTLGPPADAGAALCTANVCPVGSEADLLQALTELDGIIAGVGRIELTASVVLTVGEADPVYNGTQDLLIDGNGFTIDGDGTSQILDHNTTAELGLEDITIDSGAGNGGRGAIAALGAVTVTDSVLTANIVDETTAVRGGAITADGSIEVSGSQVINNTARTIANDARGGALFSGDEVVVINSTVTGNTAEGASTGAGGAAYGENRVSFQGSTVTDNDATAQSISRGGAASSVTTIDVTDSEFARNGAGTGGGSNGGYGGALHTEGSVTVTRSGFDHNVAIGTNVAQGGAIHATVGDITVEDSIFVENDARATNSLGEGGALFGLTGPDITIIGSTLRDNRALSTNGTANGGGVHVENGSVEVRNGAVVRNRAQGALSWGGGIHTADSPVTVYDGTIAGNIASNGGGISTNSAIDLRFATVVDNNSPTSAQIVTSGTMSAAASVVARPKGSGTVNCATNNTVSQVANFDSGPTCGFGAGPLDVNNGGDPLIGPARDNGGPRLGPAGATETTAPLARLTAHPLLGSPLIDVLDPANCALARNEEPNLIDDERDLPRPIGFNCDVGAMEALFPAHGFSDVSNFYDPTVRWITSEFNTPNILDGYGNNTFRHKLNITRGQAARLYYRAAGQPPVAGLPQHGFTDVTPFYRDAVRWAKAFGVFDGFVDKTFRQANPITRGNYIRSLYGFAGGPDVSSLGPHGFGDVTDYYDDAVTWARANALVNGYDNNTFRQKNNITRGDASRTAFNLAQSPAAWEDDGANAYPNMLFKENIP